MDPVAELHLWDYVYQNKRTYREVALKGGFSLMCAPAESLC